MIAPRSFPLLTLTNTEDTIVIEFHHTDEPPDRSRVGEVFKVVVLNLPSGLLVVCYHDLTQSKGHRCKGNREKGFFCLVVFLWTVQCPR